jgi:hypothetical protein
VPGAPLTANIPSVRMNMALKANMERETSKLEIAGFFVNISGLLIGSQFEFQDCLDGRHFLISR